MAAAVSSIAIRPSSNVRAQNRTGSSSSPAMTLKMNCFSMHKTQHACRLRCLQSSSSGFFFIPSRGLRTEDTRNRVPRRSREVVVMSMDVGLGVMGTKLGMMTHFRPDGEVVPVTVVGFKDGNIVTQIKLEATHGYNSVQIGYDRVLERHLTKPEIGHLSKSGILPLRHLQEFRLRSSIVKQYLPGQQLVLMELFKEGDKVDVSGITVGKGFQGVMKRHGFSGGPSSHGSRHHRGPGSIASGTGRVFPGKKMPGRMGCKKRKSRGLEIVKIDPEHRVVLLKGAVPGKHGNLLRIAPTKVGRCFFPKD